MNALSVRTHTIPFNVEPIFRIYGEVATYFSIPTPELVLNHYETNVKYKLEELRYQAGGGIFEPDAYKGEVDELLGMKSHLETRELIDVFHTFHIMYVDNYGELHNFPVKEVW